MSTFALEFEQRSPGPEAASLKLWWLFWVGGLWEMFTTKSYCSFQATAKNNIYKMSSYWTIHCPVFLSLPKYFWNSLQTCMQATTTTKRTYSCSLVDIVCCIVWPTKLWRGNKDFPCQALRSHPNSFRGWTYFYDIKSKSRDINAYGRFARDGSERLIILQTLRGCSIEGVWLCFLSRFRANTKAIFTIEWIIW